VSVEDSKYKEGFYANHSGDDEYSACMKKTAADVPRRGMHLKAE
jgi:hypothetical protein